MPPFQEAQPETIEMPQRVLATVEDIDQINQRLLVMEEDRILENERIKEDLTEIKGLIRIQGQNALMVDDVERIVQVNIPDVKDGETPSDARLKKLISSVLPKPQTAKKGEDGKAPENVMTKEDEIDFSRIKNFPWHEVRRQAEGSAAVGSSSLAAWGGSRIMETQTTVDDTTVGFQFAAKPTEVVINGTAYIESGGAYTWSYDAGVVTLNNPVGTGGQIYARQ